MRKLGDLFWTFPWLSGFLFSLGGWCCKWVRRQLIPITGAILALAYGIAFWRCLLYCITTMIAFSFGYSPQVNNWFVIFLVGASYGATPLFLGNAKKRRWWPLFSGLWFLLLMGLSLNNNWFTWKWVEGLVGFLHGFMVSWAIGNQGGD